MPKAIRFNIRAIIGGVECPVQSGSVICKRDAPSQCDLHLAPTKEIARIIPKTLVQVFYFDAEDKQWHLMFDGEVIFRGRVKTDRSRSFRVVAEGVSNYFFRSYIYMLNEVSGITYADSSNTSGIGGDSGLTASQRMDDISTLLEGDLPQTFAKIIGHIPEFNEFNADAFKRLKILSRIQTLPDPQIVDLFVKKHLFEEVFEVLVRSQTSDAAPIMTLLNGLMDLLYYEYIENPTPSSMSSQIVFKPKAYFCPVPRCNIFFPNRYQSLTEERNFMSEPTRLLLRTNLSYAKRVSTPGADIRNIVRLAPSELQAAMEAIQEENPAETDGEEAQKAFRALMTKKLTEEEKTKGILPDYVALTTSEWLMASDPNATESESTEDGGDNLAWLGNICDYKFFLRKFEHRSIQITHSFNPWVVCGYPGAVLDEYGNSFGIVDSVVHSFSKNHGVSTNITLTYTMNPEDEEVAANSKFAFPPLPPWFSAQYANGGAYASTIGSAAVAGSAEASAATLDKFFDGFKKSKGHLQYTLDVNRRPVVTEGEYMAFVGAGGNGEPGKATVYSGGPFVGKTQEAVRAHVQFLGKRKALLGF